MSAAALRVFAESEKTLRAITLANAKGMTVAEDSASSLVLHAAFANPLKPDEPMWFGIVRTGKAYVGYHLMPLHMNARLSALVTPGFKKRFIVRALRSPQDAAVFEKLRAQVRDLCHAYPVPGL